MAVAPSSNGDWNRGSDAEAMAAIAVSQVLAFGREGITTLSRDVAHHGREVRCGAPISLEGQADSVPGAKDYRTISFRCLEIL